jgi:hypothetical protein
MYRKIVIAFIFCSMIFQGLYAQEKASFFLQKDTIKEVRVSNKLIDTELETMDFPFFDLDAEKIYYRLQLSGHKKISASSFIYIELKKKTNMQFKLKPLYTKKFYLTPCATRPIWIVSPYLQCDLGPEILTLLSV